MKQKRLAVQIICIALAAMLTLSLALIAIGSTGAYAIGEEYQGEIDSIEAQKEELQAERADMQAGIDELEAQRASVLEQKAALDAQNELARQEIELIDEQISLYTSLVEEKARELEQAEAEEAAQLDTYKTHIRAMEENGKYTYLDIIFRSASLSELLTAIDQIGEIMEADKRLYDEYSAAREHTEDVKAEYESTLAELSDRSDELEAQKADLEEQIASAVDLINELEADLEQARAEYAANEAAEAALNSQLDAINAEIAAQEEAARQEAAQNNQEYTGTGSTATGSYIWPCPSSTYVTSRYGYRTHPIFGDERFHSGIDISANEGATIIAADSGTVSVATYSSSYGNYVTIYHSNGTYTLYAHMSSLAVSAGQTVSQGDTIGYAGSTGWATGPHLHFEIRSNGGTVDPLAYFSNYSLAPDA
ncbi:MAG TPA: peptidoglycan DD-metalloendopeptidase family protein [Candidatus Scatomorpha intestinavium]|uniref:Peptidoglycan DD-metalloendopeptidase family protein n=1 Tax=Candidatus Scatomorpha intestinavium TaxID=2840922 RepID=A0A9D0ZET1_9FIRM|nr:peptidoglycan DD-metalloendopeptidase family protein [Candidatus Scatomorpha intestinavium]